MKAIGKIAGIIFLIGSTRLWFDDEHTASILSATCAAILITSKEKWDVEYKSRWIVVLPIAAIIFLIRAGVINAP